jgi:hypothetical protein
MKRQVDFVKAWEDQLLLNTRASKRFAATLQSSAPLASASECIHPAR